MRHDARFSLVERRLNRRQVLRGGAALGLGLPLLSGLSAQAASSITFWYATNAQETDYAKAVVSAWNKSQTTQVKAQPVPAGNSTEEVVLAAIAARTTPCALANVAPNAVPEYGQGLVDLSKTFKDADSFLVERSGKTIVDQYRSSDGDLYQVPWKTNPVMVFFRKDLFQKAGLDPTKPPRTYTQALDAMGKLKAAGFTPIQPDISQNWYSLWWTWYPLYLAASSQLLLDKSGKKAIFNDAAGQGAMNFWREVYQKGYAPKATSQQDPYGAGKVAMVISGPWEIPSIQQGKLLDATDVMPVWVPDDSPLANNTELPYTYADAKNISIFTTCDNKDDTWKFVEYYVSKDNDVKFFQMTQQIPLRQGIDQLMPEGFFTEYPLLKPFAQQAARTLDVDLNSHSIDIFTAIMQAYQSAAIYSKSTTESAMKKAEDQVNSLVGSS